MYVFSFFTYSLISLLFLLWELQYTLILLYKNYSFLPCKYCNLHLYAKKLNIFLFVKAYNVHFFLILRELNFSQIFFKYMIINLRHQPY